MWHIISTLTIDPDPTPTAEAQYACNMDAPLFAANTTRGKAIEGAVKYALWLRNNGINFADVPEVRQVLDEHLTTDPSIAIHSIYGRFFPWLVVLDKAWAKENRTTIFDGAAGSVAWEAYVTFSPAYDDVAGLLTQYYERAIVALDRAATAAARTSKPDPDEHLGEHLMAQYWRDRLALLNRACSAGSSNARPSTPERTLWRTPDEASRRIRVASAKACATASSASGNSGAIRATRPSGRRSDGGSRPANSTQTGPAH